MCVHPQLWSLAQIHHTGNFYLHFFVKINSRTSIFLWEKSHRDMSCSPWAVLTASGHGHTTPHETPITADFLHTQFAADFLLSILQPHLHPLFLTTGALQNPSLAKCVCCYAMFCFYTDLPDSHCPSHCSSGFLFSSYPENAGGCFWTLCCPIILAHQQYL